MVRMMIEIKPLDTLTTPRECALKLLEEASEACEAIKEHDKVQDWSTYQKAMMELADVEQCVCNCLHVLNATASVFEDAVRAVQKHNLERVRNEMRGTMTLKIDWR